MAKNIISKVFNQIRSYFFNGLLILVPITVTFGLFALTYRFIKDWLTPIAQIEPEYLQTVPGSEIVLVLIFIVVVGAIVKIFFLEPLIHAIESIFFKIPLMRPIYGGIKQLVQAFTVDQLTFKKVVMVEFPRKGIYSIGFLSNELSPEIAPIKEEKIYNVYIPTTPNPTSGFLVQIPESEMVVVDLTRQEAMSLIISGGIIKPSRFK